MKFRTILLLISVFATQGVYATDGFDDSDKPCQSLLSIIGERLGISFLNRNPVLSVSTAGHTQENLAVAYIEKRYIKEFREHLHLRQDRVDRLLVALDRHILRALSDAGISPYRVRQEFKSIRIFLSNLDKSNIEEAVKVGLGKFDQWLKEYDPQVYRLSKNLSNFRGWVSIGVGPDVHRAGIASRASFLDLRKDGILYDFEEVSGAGIRIIKILQTLRGRIIERSREELGRDRFKIMRKFEGETVLSLRLIKLLREISSEEQLLLHAPRYLGLEKNISEELAVDIMRFMNFSRGFEPPLQYRDEEISEILLDKILENNGINPWREGTWALFVDVEGVGANHARVLQAQLMKVNLEETSWAEIVDSLSYGSSLRRMRRLLNVSDRRVKEFLKTYNQGIVSAEDRIERVGYRRYGDEVVHVFKGPFPSEETKMQLVNLVGQSGYRLTLVPTKKWNLKLEDLFVAEMGRTRDLGEKTAKLIGRHFDSTFEKMKLGQKRFLVEIVPMPLSRDRALEIRIHMRLPDKISVEQESSLFGYISRIKSLLLDKGFPKETIERVEKVSLVISKI